MGQISCLFCVQDFDELDVMPSITLENNVIHNNEGYGVILVKPSTRPPLDSEGRPKATMKKQNHGSVSNTPFAPQGTPLDRRLKTNSREDFQILSSSSRHQRLLRPPRTTAAQTPTWRPPQAGSGSLDAS